MSLFNFKKKPTTPQAVAAQNKKVHEVAIKKIMDVEEKRLQLTHRKNDCRIMLKECEECFRQTMAREVDNARYARQIGIEDTLNKAHFSDAMSGIACVERARWYMDTITSEDGLHGALRMLNQALKCMYKLDGGIAVVNASGLQKRVDKLYQVEELAEDEAVLPPTDDYKYKFENGLFENMVQGMSYEKARQVSAQDMKPGAAPMGTTADYSGIFGSQSSTESAEMKRMRQELMESRKRET